MDWIVIKHLVGSKENQVEKFPIDESGEILIGREPIFSIIFDEETEAMVSRRHAAITWNPSDASQFFINDLGSLNGTYVNGQRISGPTLLEHEAVVQLGSDGPSFQFEIEQITEPLVPELLPDAQVDHNQLYSRQEVVSEPDNSSPDWPLAHTINQPEEPEDHVAAEDDGRSTIGLGVLSGIVISVLALAVVGFLLYRSGWLNRSTETPQQQSNGLASGPSRYDHLHLNGSAADAEKDEQRMAWRIEANPYLVLGSGRPGNGASDIAKPDGIAFGPMGLLYATDAANRRLQVWNIKTGKLAGEFGHKVFVGEIADVAVSPEGSVWVTDRTVNLAYVFEPSPQSVTSNADGPSSLKFKGTYLAGQGLKKPGDLAIDSKGRIYVVDTGNNNVLRFKPDGKVDKGWEFEQKQPDGATYIQGSESLVIDEPSGRLFVASERDTFIRVFDSETGAYQGKLIGASLGSAGDQSGKNVFFGPVKGLTIVHDHLLAVDENAGHIQVFNLARPDTFNTNLVSYNAPREGRPAGYLGFFGSGPMVDFEDRTNTDLQGQVKSGAIIPGKANPPGHFCSPRSIASYPDHSTGETFIAIADQCNYRIVVYRWSDISKSLGISASPVPGIKAVARPPVKKATKKSAKPEKSTSKDKKKKKKKSDKKKN